MGSFRIGTLFGVPINLKVSFLVLLGVILLTYRSLEGVLLLLLTFGMVLLHELGHALVARRLHVPIVSIDFHFFGGAARMARPPRSARHEVLIAAAGPAVSFALALLALLLWLATGLGLLRYLLWVNLLLGAFNLLPALPMDGGRILRAALCGRMGYLPATRLAVRIARGLTLALGLWGLLGLWPLGASNFFLVALAVVLWLMAGAELRAATLLSYLEQEGVRDFCFGRAPSAPIRRRHSGELRVEVLDRQGRRITGPQHRASDPPEEELELDPAAYPFDRPIDLPPLGWVFHRPGEQGSGELRVEERDDGGFRRWVVRDRSGRVIFSSEHPFGP